MRFLAITSVLLAPALAFAQTASPPAGTEPPPAATTDKYAGAALPPPGGWRLMMSDLTLMRLNPIGLETRARIGMQKRLYKSDSKVGRNNFGFMGAYPRLNPAAAMIGLGGELQPASIFNLKAYFEVQKYFGTFGFLQGFASPDQNFSDQTLKDLRDVPGEEPLSATVLHGVIAPQLMLKFGDVAVRALFQLEYWDMGLEDGDTVAYEATVDTLLPDKGITLQTDTDVLYMGRPGLAIGLRHTWVRPVYKSRHFADPDLSATENAEVFDRFGASNGHQRVGLFAAYTLRDRGPSTFNKPTILLIASWYLDHRYRTGAPDAMRPNERADDFTSRGFPYFLAGFAFESDLMAVR
jgi:hypothetical protein